MEVSAGDLVQAGGVELPAFIGSGNVEPKKVVNDGIRSWARSIRGEQDFGRQDTFQRIFVAIRQTGVGMTRNDKRR